MKALCETTCTCFAATFFAVVFFSPSPSVFLYRIYLLRALRSVSQSIPKWKWDFSRVVIFQLLAGNTTKPNTLHSTESNKIHGSTVNKRFCSLATFILSPFCCTPCSLLLLLFFLSFEFVLRLICSSQFMPQLSQRENR